jgi:hypothetical protein
MCAAFRRLGGGDGRSEVVESRDGAARLQRRVALSKLVWSTKQHLREMTLDLSARGVITRITVGTRKGQPVAMCSGLNRDSEDHLHLAGALDYSAVYSAKRVGISTTASSAPTGKWSRDPWGSGRCKPTPNALYLLPDQYDEVASRGCTSIPCRSDEVVESTAMQLLNNCGYVQTQLQVGSVEMVRRVLNSS